MSGSWIEHHVDDGLRHRLYLSGDTRVLFSTVTMDADQGVDFVRRVAAQRVVPVHCDHHKVFKSPLSAFERAGDAAGFRTRLKIPARGKTIELPPTTSNPATTT